MASTSLHGPVKMMFGKAFGGFPLPEPLASSSRGAVTTSNRSSEQLSVVELSTGRLAELLSNGDAKELPEQYLVKELERPTLSHKEWADPPIIDFTEIYAGEAALAEKIGAACRNWGFFQLVNHAWHPTREDAGVPRTGVEVFRNPDRVEE